MKKLLTILFLFMVIPMASAGLFFEQFEELDLKRACINNNTYCSPSAECNVTILRPDSTILIDNALMTNQGAFHNFTLDAGQTSNAGQHIADIVCLDAGINGYESFDFVLTANGLSQQDNNTLQTFFIILYTIIVIFIIIGYALDKTILHFIAGLMLMVAAVLIGINSLGNLSDTFIQEIIITLSAGIGFYYVVFPFFSQERQVETFQGDDDGRHHD